MRHVRRAGWIARQQALGDRDATKWYSVKEFLELKDVEDDHASRAPLPPEKHNALATRGKYQFHKPGSPLDRAK